MAPINPAPSSSVRLLSVSRKWDRVLLADYYTRDGLEDAASARAVAVKVLASAVDQHVSGNPTCLCAH